jgi:hypothetical protein
MAKTTVTINRAPVLTLWATVVAERLGFSTEESLTLGKAVAGLNAQAKGRSLGIFKPPRLAGGEKPRKRGLGEEFWVNLCGRAVPAINTKTGVCAVIKDKPIDPQQVKGYLTRQFGDDLPMVRNAMDLLARSREPDALADGAFALYERFRPQVAPGKRGWGQKGVLDLDRIRSLARKG